MSELAFDMNGDPIVLPATAQYWRVRRFRSPGSRGAPEIVETKEGAPLLLPIDIGFLEFREIVESVAGRYRLDPVDEKRKIISNAPAAYLTIADAPRNGMNAIAAAGTAESPDTVLRELARANVEMARVNADVSRNIADRFAGIMQAAAEVIRAADGAGIVARLPPEVPFDDSSDDEEVEEQGEQAPDAGFAALAGQILPMIQMWLQVKQAKETATATPAAEGNATGEQPAPRATVRNGTPTPAQVAHLLAVQSLLSPREAAVARETAMKLSSEDRAELLAELETMTVEQAAIFVRSMLPKMKDGAS